MNPVLNTQINSYKDESFLWLFLIGNYILSFAGVKVKVSNPYTGLDRLWGSQESEDPDFKTIST
jgi:hypothetical protein